MALKGYEIKFNIYAEDEREAEMARQAIIGFIAQHARQGRAVTGSKVAEAVSNWERNPFVKNQIIKYLTNG